ncbi:MAG TPA: hypothetical protein VNZ50_02025 [Hyphomicrobiaceae bacterium]|nr:hypothetical protein [Hyphomicrobiaceae bacterium]
MTTASPTNRGNEPISNPPAMIAAQIAITSGLVATALMDVVTATAAPTSRSSNSGNEMTLITKTNAAKAAPTRLPTTIRLRPDSVVSTLDMKAPSDSGS